jgi:hypothetical protein
MKRHRKYAIAAIVSAILVALVPYIVVRISQGENMWKTIQNSGKLAYPPGWRPPLVYDHFDAKVLNSTWKFTDPKGGSSINLDTRESWLTITTTSPPSRDWIDEPRLMQSNITGNFSIATEVQSAMSGNGESAGILVWKDPQNCVRLDRTRGEDNQDQILFGVKGGNYITYNLTSDLDPTRLLLKRYGNNLTGYYFDANGWPFEVGCIAFSMEDPVDVGLHITVTHEGSFSAFFDYFDLEQMNSTDSVPSRYSSTSAMWITTSEMDPSLIMPGYRFNATVWLKMSWDVQFYQLTMLFDSAQIKCIRAGFTGSTSSAYMAGKGATFEYVKIDDASNGGNGNIVATELCNGNEYIPGPHTGSLIWAEFEVTKIGRSFLSISKQSSETYVSGIFQNFANFQINKCTIDLNR